MIHAGCVKVASGKPQTGLDFTGSVKEDSVKGVLNSARISASEVNNQFSLIWS